MNLTCRPTMPGSSTRREKRRDDLQGWMATLTPMAEALQVLLGLLRDSGTPQRMVAHRWPIPTESAAAAERWPPGQGLPVAACEASTPATGLVPEITGHRLMVSVRFMKPRRGRPFAQRPRSDTTFELSLCA